MTEKEKMLAGMLYTAFGEELGREYVAAKKLTAAYNATAEDEPEKRESLLKELLGSVGKECAIKPPFHCDYGKNIYIGDKVFINYECIVLDVCKVTIGNNVLIGPRVNLIAATHPLDKDTRISGLEYGAPITICDNVWLGAGVTVNPGVTIGENSVIGSSSVVTRDIPANSVAVGVPCRVIKTLEKA